MYFWKTGQLAMDIKEGKLEELTKKNYYLAGTIVTLVSMFLISISAHKNVYSSALEFLSLIIIMIVGINLTFASNKGNSGIDYISRVVALSLPLSIKVFLFGFIFGFIVGFLSAVTKNTAFMPWAISLFSVAVQIWFFWRINTHLKTINA